jgi:hypothetical protein
MAKLIGIRGYVGAGKDTLAAMIAGLLSEYPIRGLSVLNLIDKPHTFISYQTGVQVRAFAEPLRDICARLIGERPETFLNRDTKDAPINSKWLNDDGSLMTRRDLLLYVGKQMRERNPEVFVDLAMRSWNTRENFIFVDVRQRNELQAIRERGGKVIEIVRPGVGPANNIDSLLDNETFDAVIINHGAIGDLYWAAHRTMEDLYGPGYSKGLATYSPAATL